MVESLHWDLFLYCLSSMGTQAISDYLFGEQLVLCDVVECSNAVELYLLEELVSSTHTSSLQTILRNLVLLNEDSLNSVSTLLRDALVDFLRTL